MSSFIVFAALAVAQQPSISTESGSMAVNIAAGRSFSISCPADGACDGQVACSGPNVEIVDGACVPTTQFAPLDSTMDSLSNVRDQLANLSRAVSGQFSTLAASASATPISPCIVGAEYTNSNGECVTISRVCRAAQVETAQATRTSDRVCADPTVCTAAQYETGALERNYDRECANLTTCGNQQYEETAPTATSNRVCVDAGSSCPRGRTGRTILIKTVAGSNVRVDTWCKNGVDYGSDGSSAFLAAKSCYTAKQVGSTDDGVYWMLGNEADGSLSTVPFRVFCDMTSCGGDMTGNWQGQNTSSCGGWTMVMRTQSGSNCLNHNKNNIWRTTSMNLNGNIGRSNSCGKFRAYYKNSFTDVMIGSARAGHYTRSIAWRHPNVKQSMFGVVNGCQQLRDGVLIVPGHGSPTTGQIRNAGIGLDWRNYRGSTSSGYPCHGLCSGGNGIPKFGFFGRDSMDGGSSIVGCRSPMGHGGNVVGFSHMNAAQSGSNIHRPNHGVDVYCISAWGFGSGYHGDNGETMNGHWWGHGNTFMRMHEHALYVRDITEV
jgi:hypothetical protein